MIEIILYIIFGIGSAYFATQNAQTVTLHIASYTYKGIPLYMIILVSLLIGLIFSWIVITVRTLSNSLRMREKELLLKEIKKKNAEIIKELHQLQLENSELKAKYEISEDDERSI
jgi:uncharacterized integral membrane protein